MASEAVELDALKQKIAYHKAEVGRLRRLKANPEPQQRELARLQTAIANMTSQAQAIQTELADLDGLLNHHFDEMEAADELLTQLVHGKEIAKLAAVKAKLDQTMEEMRASGLDPEAMLKELMGK